MTISYRAIFGLATSLLVAAWLGACRPASNSAGGQVVANDGTIHTLEVNTYGSGGESLLGGLLALRANMAQSIEVIYQAVTPTNEDGRTTHQEVILRYAQEPAPTPEE